MSEVLRALLDSEHSLTSGTQNVNLYPQNYASRIYRYLYNLLRTLMFVRHQFASAIAPHIYSSSYDVSLFTAVVLLPPLGDFESLSLIMF